MSASYNFRTAFNGFNREDVVHYIEYINSKHTTQLNQLRTDLTAAQQENAQLKAQPQHNSELEAQITALNEKLAQLEEELLTAQIAKSDLETQLAVLQQAVTGSKTALKDAATTLYTIRLTGEE